MVKITAAFQFLLFALIRCTNANPKYQNFQIQEKDGVDYIPGVKAFSKGRIAPKDGTSSPTGCVAYTKYLLMKFPPLVYPWNGKHDDRMYDILENFRENVYLDIEENFLPDSLRASESDGDPLAEQVY